MRIALDTLGCKLNQAESELLARQLLEAGHQLVDDAVTADIYILNTCTVTHTADSKSRHLLRLAHRKNPDIPIVVTGCYAQRASGVLKKIDGVSLVVNNPDKPHLFTLLRDSGYLNGQGNLQGKTPLEPLQSPRTRSFVKVQDGCSSFCSYCIVPMVRNPENSLPVEQVIDEVNQRVLNGFKEVVITGTKVGSYRYGDTNLKGLLERILSETNILRIRLSSLQPQEISRELIELWEDSRLCPHFHLSLQSGSDSVLKRMNRRYTTRQYEQAVSLIRSLVPRAAITTDIITGFPGETDNEFQESYDFCRKMGFARIHVFPYSIRSGTKAAEMPDQVDDTTKKSRTRQMLALAAESTGIFRQKFSGEIMNVLWEKQTGKGVWSGITDNYIRVYIQSNEDITNRILPLKLV